MIQEKKLLKLTQLLYKKSEQINLFSKSDRELLWDKHVQDALALVRAAELKGDKWQLQSGMRVMDLGTGGGLPGLVLAVCYPGVDFALVDARQKKITAVMEVAQELGLQNVTGIAGRFEDLARAKEHRGQFDMVVARAVASLPTLLEYAVGFLQLDGSLIAWKADQAQLELQKADRAMDLLAFGYGDSYEYTLPTGEYRALLRFVKYADTLSDYPRKPNLPKANPL